MKKLFINNKGAILVHVYIIALIIFIVLLSTLTILVKDFEIVQSNSNGIKAYFLAEAAMEEAYFQLDTLINRGVLLYLQDFNIYKLDFINRMEEGIITKDFFEPPLLQDYLQQEVFIKLADLKELKDNPFKDYKQNHYYSKVLTYNPHENIIEIYTMGEYNRAKRYIKSKVEMPFEFYEGNDEYELPNIKVSPPKINCFYQSY